MRVKRDSRERDAVLSKTGLSVAHSDPGLMEPTSPPTSDRKSGALLEVKQGAATRPALHQHKRGREFEGRALIGGAAAVPLASLDKKKNNRDTPYDPYRASRCGRLSLRGINPSTPDLAKFVRVTCKCWDCPACSKNKANRYRKAIAELAESHRLNILLTLTLDPGKLNGKDSTRHINEVFAYFRTYLKRKLGHSPKYIRVLEYQKNGRAHLHVLLGKHVQQRWVSEAWAALGGGKVVDIRRVSMRKVSHYLSKYLTKEMILSAPKRSRRVTTSRGITLNPKKQSPDTWTLIRIPIDVLYRIHWKAAEDITRDKEGNVASFDVPIPPEEKQSPKVWLHHPPLHS